MTTRAEANSEANSGDGKPHTLSPWLSWRRKRFWLLLILLTYTLAGFFLTPRIIESQLTRIFEETGRSVSISETKINPFLLTLEITGLEILDTDAVTLFSLGRFFADIQTSSLFHLALTFKTLSIEQPRMNEERFGATDTRLVRLIKDLTPQRENDDEARESGPPPVYLQSLNVEDAYFRILDQTLDGFEAEAGPLTVRLANIRTRPDHVGSQAVDLLISGTDRIQWRGELQLVPFRSSGSVQSELSALPQTRQLLDLFLPFGVDFASLKTNFDYQASIGAQGFNAVIEGLSGELSGFEAVMNAGDEAFVELPMVRFNGGSFAYPAKMVDLERLELAGLVVRATLNGDRELNLLDMIPEAGQEAPPGDPDTNTSALADWTINLDEFEMTEGAVNLADESVNPTLNLSLTPVRIMASAVDNQPGTRIPLSFEAGLASGGTVEFSGEAIALPRPELAGTVQLKDIQTALAQPYVNEFLNVGLSSGALSLSAEIVHRPDQMLAAEGTFSYQKFALQDLLLEEQLAGWELLQLDRFELDMAQKTLATTELEFTQLYGRLHIAEDRSTNVGDLLVTAPTANGKNGGDTRIPDFTVTIGGVVMQDTALDFSDLSLPLPFDAAIRDMDGSVSALSTRSEEPAEIEVEGRVNEFGLARISGTTQILNPTNNTDIKMVFRNLDIARLSPYTVSFSGFPIEAGRLDLDLGYQLQQRKLLGDNQVVVREIELGEKSELPGAGSLPLRLAVALLTDSEGVIDLAVPVEGDLDNPEFRIGGVVLRALGNIITKAVTAPFRLLGGLVGVDSENFGTLTFQPGRSDISPPDQEQLVKLGEAMLKRPELSVEVAGSWSTELDRPALQAASVAAEIDAWLQANPGDATELTVTRDRRVLEALTVRVNPTADLAALKAPFLITSQDDPEGEPVLDEVAYNAALQAQLRAQIDVSESQLIALAQARGQAVVEGLVAGQPDATLRVNAVEPAEVEPGDDETISLELAVAVDD